jgi:hypothetical protein
MNIPPGVDVRLEEFFRNVESPKYRLPVRLQRSSGGMDDLTPKNLRNIRPGNGSRMKRRIVSGRWTSREIFPWRKEVAVIL